MSHTPGPWTVAIQHDDYGWTEYAINDQSEDADQEVANSCLIAAAPELLAQCKRVVAWFEALKQNQNEQLVAGQSLESASRNWETMTAPSLDLQPTMDAIAKAEGR